MRAFPADSMSLVKEIKIPQGWYGVEIFVGENKLVITATKSGYSTNSKVDSRIAMPYYYNRDVRTIAAVYDISSLPTVKLERYYQVEGSLRTARRIDGKLYLLSASDASIPYNVAYDSR